MVYELLIKLYFRSNSLCITYLFLSFTEKKYSNVLNGGVRETSTGSSSEISREPNNGIFKGRPRDVGQNVFLNSTQKLIKLTLTGYSVIVNGTGKNFCEQFMVQKII